MYLCVCVDCGHQQQGKHIIRCEVGAAVAVKPIAHPPLLIHASEPSHRAAAITLGLEELNVGPVVRMGKAVRGQACSRALLTCATLARSMHRTTCSLRSLLSWAQ